ncbi:putative purine-cytosine permease [Phaeomoniella chlamydospora]|uniref:Putative purine-cytosine permease n=1 Tax=Phaeomoniella chlamydospora TaxID=158046 RepID=A0A0G2GEU4_PHACM|nr:putative purine-cytosine permease [Phaeomoniella chlamydospora]
MALVESPEKKYSQSDPHDILSKEVYGVDAEDLGQVSKATGWALKTRMFVAKIGAEEGGIERIPEALRTDQHPRDLFTLFTSVNIGTATLAFGTLGPVLFGLGWWDSFLALLFFNIIGAIPPALAATLGPKTGLRTMCMPRYSFGWWPAKLVAFINLTNQIGWAMVNTIAGADILYDVGNTKLPLTVAVLIIGLCAWVIGLFGYQWVHRFERYFWIVILICMIILAGFGGKHFHNIPWGSGPSETSGILSFGTSIIGFQISWATIAADYGVYMRETLKPWKVFTWTFFGLFLSQFFIECLGAALMLTVNVDPAFAAAYDKAGFGGLTGQVFEGYGSGVRGFGKFIQVILAFSVVSVVIANIYSLGLNIQIISSKLLKVPRFLWSVLGGAAFLAAAIAGRDHLEEAMEDFLNVIAYWLTPFLAILCMEHLVWRRGYQYDLTAWDDPSKLPYGIAALVTFAIGTTLAILCMSQTWWVGPIALAVGNPPYGTDISWELALGATIILYIPLRWAERKYLPHGT